MAARGEVLSAMEGFSAMKFETVPGKMTMNLSYFITILKECVWKRKGGIEGNLGQTTTIPLTLYFYCTFSVLDIKCTTRK
jgi:hypothetical protein